MGLNNFTGSNNDDHNGSNGGGISGGVPFPQQMSGGGGYDPSEFLINYNDRFANSGKILFRNNIRAQLMGVLIGKNKPNALLIGPAGVGKTKIVEDLAYCLASKDPLVPDKLQDHIIYELPLSNIVSGSSYVGQLEEKLKAVIEFLSDKKNRAIISLMKSISLRTTMPARPTAKSHKF